jgi:Adenylyl/Guanylyl and SMODS C-terminal sensor domain
MVVLFGHEVAVISLRVADPSTRTAWGARSGVRGDGIFWSLPMSANLEAPPNRVGQIHPTTTAEQSLREVADALEISDTRYQSAERSYRSVAAWLERPGSRFAGHELRVYSQGSFRIGTPIRPVNEDEKYDLDVVFENKTAEKISLSQKDLQDQLGAELRAYAEQHGMNPPERGRFCWTLHYADGAQFAMDVLPSLSEGVAVRRLLEQRSFSTQWVDSAVAIPDAHHPHFLIRSDDWRTSNPAGYAAWFQSRQQVVFEARRRALALESLLAKAEDLPEYRVKTPLQATVQILKRHRDVFFTDEPAVRPRSIMLTTLIAQAYRQETGLSSSLLGVLDRLEGSIELIGSEYWVSNPADGRENFADVWRERPSLRSHFFKWLAAARQDFNAIAQSSDRTVIEQRIRLALGEQLVQRIEARKRASEPARKLAGRSNGVRAAIRELFQAPHKRAPRWPLLQIRSASIESATFTRSGFRKQEFSSDGPALPKGADLRFELASDVPAPYQVYWQVVNTGPEAEAVSGGLRGGFDEGSIERGKPIRAESTRYRGSHSIEAFIVKDGYCVATTGPFIVNIA